MYPRAEVATANEACTRVLRSPACQGTAGPISWPRFAAAAAATVRIVIHQASRVPMSRGGSGRRIRTVLSVPTATATPAIVGTSRSSETGVSKTEGSPVQQSDGNPSVQSQQGQRGDRGIGQRGVQGQQDTGGAGGQVSGEPQHLGAGDQESA